MSEHDVMLNELARELPPMPQDIERYDTPQTASAVQDSAVAASRLHPGAPSRKTVWEHPQGQAPPDERRPVVKDLGGPTMRAGTGSAARL